MSTDIDNFRGAWFPKLPSYQAFSRRLSELAPAFQALTEIWLEQLSDGLDQDRDFLVDSYPVILAKQARSGHARVASEVCGKSYNSSRDEYYYGVKLHAFAQRNPRRLPSPKALMIAPAPEHDLTAAKQIMRNFCPVSCGTFYADKAYIDVEWAQLLHTEYDIQICTPRKKQKGDTLRSGDAFSTFVSMRHQPIECFLNWLNYHTAIQFASKVRSLAGLFFHIFSRLATALFQLCFNS